MTRSISIYGSKSNFSAIVALSVIAIASTFVVRPGLLGFGALVLKVASMATVLYLVRRTHVSLEGVERKAWRDASDTTLEVALVAVLLGAGVLQVLEAGVDSHRALLSALFVFLIGTHTVLFKRALRRLR